MTTAVSVGLALLLAAGACALWWVDRYGRGAVLRVAGCLAWGAVCGVTLAPLTHHPPGGAALGWGLTASASGQLLMVALPLAAAVAGWLYDPLDAALVGLTVGSAAGAVRGALAASGGWGAAAMVLLDAAAAAIAASGVAVAFLAPKVMGRFARAAFTLALAVALEGGGNAAAAEAPRRWPGWEPSGAVALLLVGVVALAAVLWAATRRESTVLRSELTEEIGFGVLPAWVMEVVPSVRRRAQAAWWPRADERRDLLRELVRLAFRKRVLRGLDPDRERVGGLEVGRTRQRLRALLATEVQRAERE